MVPNLSFKQNFDMIKPHKRTIGATVILLMLGASPLSVTYSFAEIEDYQEEKEKNAEMVSKNTKKEGFRAILIEKVVNGKLEVQHYALPNDLSEGDMQRIPSFDGQTSGWAYVNYKTYHSGIVLFDGKASKIGENLWKISTNGVLNLGEIQFDLLELSGKFNDSHVVMHGTASDEDLSYRIIFSGKIAETGEENLFAVSFINSDLKNLDIFTYLKIFQIGKLAINSEKIIGSNQEFRNTI